MTLTERESENLIDRIRRIYTSCTVDEKTCLMKILQELSDTGYSDTYNNLWLADFKEIPVDIITFISSEYYLGGTNRNGDAVYPFWKGELSSFFGSGNRYYEWIFTGATRIGKTSTAVTAAAYMLYRLMCLKDPQKFFNKKVDSIFSILFFNITKELARGVAYREFNDTLKSSKWFCAHGEYSRSEENFYYIPEGGQISIDYGSDSSHGLGKQVFVALMDECNFSKAGIRDVNKAKARMRETYNTLSARVKGTFKHGGEVFGKIFAVSSKNSDSDFMEAYVEEQLAAGSGDHMFISDAPQWEVLPKETFSKEHFYIAVGDRHKKGFVVPDNQCFDSALDDLRSQGYRLLTPPMDMRTDFVADFDVALRDLAGISVVGSFSFIAQDFLSKCINKSRRNPFYTDILQIGTKDNLSIEEFFHAEEVPDSLKRVPIFIHLDLSLNTDRTGISGCGITGTKDIVGRDNSVMAVPVITHMFSVALQAPRGDKIAYDKVLSFICWLRKSGFHIGSVSRDQFQSEYLGQQIAHEGFEDKKLSLDRTPDGYIALRSVLTEERIDMLDVQLLQDELVHLQRDSVTGKCDHVVGGSKDVADSFAGCVWNAILTNPPVRISSQKLVSAMARVNGPRNMIGKPKTVEQLFRSKRK